MVSSRPLPRLALLASAAAVLHGCGPDGPALHPAAGTVTFDDGSPVAGAVVEFLPDGGGPAARGRTDAEGRFALATGGVPGAVAGGHRVGIARTVSMDGMPGHARHMGAAKTVPPTMASPATSGLTETVTAGGTNEFSFVVAPPRGGS